MLKIASVENQIPYVMDKTRLVVSLRVMIRNPGFESRQRQMTKNSSCIGQTNVKTMETTTQWTSSSHSSCVDKSVAVQWPRKRVVSVLYSNAKISLKGKLHPTFSLYCKSLLQFIVLVYSFNIPLTAHLLQIKRLVQNSFCCF